MRSSPAFILVLITLLCTMSAAASSSIVNLTLAPGQAEYVDLVAFQNGTEPWREVSPEGGIHALEVTDAAGRFGVAVVCSGGGADRVRLLEARVLQATTAELTAVTLPCEGAMEPTPRTAELTGSVSNVAEGFDQLEVLTEHGSGRARREQGYAFALAGLTRGVHDVLVAALDDGQGILHLALRHGVDVENGGRVTIDFNSGAAPAEFGLTVHNALPGRPASVTTFLRTWNGTSALLSTAFAAPSSNSFEATFLTVPTHVLGAGDMHYLNVATTDEHGQYLGVDRIFYEGEELQLSLPEGHLDLTAAPVLPGSYPRYGVTWADVGAALTSSKVSVITPDLHTEWRVSVTRGWSGENTYHLPDLSSLPSWKPEWNTAPEAVTYANAELSAVFGPVATSLNFIYDRQPGESRYIRANVVFAH